MLQFILWYYLGKYYYDLAVKYDKNKWLFAILSIVIYYAGIFLCAGLLGIFLAFVDPSMLETISDRFLSILFIPVGLLVCWGVYRYLENYWKKQADLSILGDNEQLLDDGFIS